LPTTNYFSVNGQIIAEETGGVQTDYVTDALGSVVATVDQNAQVINRYTYKPYGGLLSKTGTGPDPKFRWVGSWGYRQTSTALNLPAQSGQNCKGSESMAFLMFLA
jgi:hypothetical protein